jgi:hypothetical protein
MAPLYLARSTLNVACEPPPRLVHHAFDRSEAVLPDNAVTKKGKDSGLRTNFAARFLAGKCHLADLRYIQNRYVRPALKNTISLDGGDCCKNVPVMKPATFNAARKCSLIAQRISRLG